MAIEVSRASTATVSFSTPQEVIINKDDDSITVYQASHDNLNANANIQVGNIDVANGNPVPVSDAGGSLTIDAVSLPLPTGAATSANQATIIALLNTAFLPGMIESPSNKTYTIDQYSIDARTLNTLAIKTSSGTCTVDIKIDGTTVTGLGALSISSVETIATASGLNTVAIGQTITLVVSSNSSSVDLVWTLKYTRN